MSSTEANARSFWQIYNARIAKKILSEFCHERFVHPAELSPGLFVVYSDDGRTEYRFRAEILALDSWSIDESSLRRIRDGVELRVDSLALIVDLAGSLGIPAESLPEYLEEFTNTLTISTNRPDARRIAAAELAEADFQTIERTMTEGHPCIVANAGRLGFSADDVERYAPESGGRFPLTWVAALRENTEFAAVSGVDYDSLVRGELGADTLAGFDAVLTERGLDPAAYYYMPVHPWQWVHKIARIYAVDIAERKIVKVGDAPDLYQPQQSIRTLFNVSNPARHYVKMALSIVNMGFTRGMSADYMRTTPLINDWVRSQVSGDPYLKSLGFELIYEVAAIGYRSTTYNALTQPGSEYRKLLSALWRESPVPRVAEHEQLTTMAALLHVDHLGTPLVEAIIRRSGLPAGEWLARYLRCYLQPIMYLLYKYEFKFSPHGENLILVLDGGVPVRGILKDIGEEVSIFAAPDGIPDTCRRAVTEEADEIRNMGVLSDVFDDYLRHLALILHARGLLADADFWSVVARAVVEFQEQHPDMSEKFRKWDLFAPTFKAIHMNRLQLSNNRRMVNLGDSYSTLVDADHELVNPIAAHRPAPERARAEEVAVS
ncbi:IucA/IucC family siderophore biosynthesis protein [Nocardia puris]|uniref:IucA/IucC family protein n=1 Tax=Nocardia puris TaxID=208602 RepID=UPI001893FDD4|nr:IucA/IucC family siderophore biosynthesis protein [Nocardia puris]MBF6212367.1 IucA/IucC family siderophore biosynthesis protein [Nocardia puris]MBF6366614.1 IucA/IucC family siderophore biosynthesis protein [Nocardia puris]MBF6460956.1 IucA/IucC family siderophore biosynthesis protein [Nocardia puris]